MEAGAQRHSSRLDLPHGVVRPIRQGGDEHLRNQGLFTLRLATAHGRDYTSVVSLKFVAAPGSASKLGPTGRG